MTQPPAEDQLVTLEAHVNQHSDGIVARLRAGTMPCDGAWPQVHVDVFQRWIDGGKVR